MNMSILHPRMPRSELAIVILIVTVGFALRCAFPNRVAVEHFDEGVYAATSNLHYFYGISDDFQYPSRYLYAPPLFPWLVRWSIDLFGPASHAPMLVNMLAGGLTVALVWWVGRRWFGSTAGLSAATLASLSDFHLVYSRTALTDVLLSLWILLAVMLIWDALRSGRALTIVAAGAATGLAWWTKYNGWLPLAIGAAGLIPWLFLKSDRRCHARPMLFRWLMIAAVACVVFSPMLIWLAPHGGYTAVAQNHQKYLVGLSGWFGSLQQQWWNQRHFDGWLSCSSLGLACVLPAVAVWFGRGCRVEHSRFSRSSFSCELESKPDQSSAPRSNSEGHVATDANPSAAISPKLLPASLVAGLFLTACGCGFGSSVVLVTLAVIGILKHTGFPTSKESSTSSDDTLLASWLLAAWFAGLILTTPLYHPYPRLTLPLLVASWIGAGAAIAWFTSRLTESLTAASMTMPPDNTERNRLWTTPIAIVVLYSISVMLWMGPSLAAKRIPAWQPRTQFASLARNVVTAARRAAASEPASEIDGIEMVLYVFGEPGLFFHLPEAGVIVQPAGNLEFVHPNAPRQRAPTFLVSGPHAHRRDANFDEQLRKYADRFQLVKTFAYHPSDLVVLNLYGPRAREHRPLEEVRLYLAKPTVVEAIP